VANPEHLKILKQGADNWNMWRANNPSIKPDLADAHLSGVSLNSFDLFLSDLDGAFLGGADLQQADLSYASLTEADLSDADLRGANFLYTNLNGANLQRAKFETSEIAWTVFGDNDLSTVSGLNTVKHKGPSTIGIDTIYQSKGQIPESFLRGCGVPDEFITFSRSLVGKAIEFHSCFISFTEADDAISERLHNDLQAAGVRCWRWKEDAKWGKTLMRSIDEAVRMYDKLVVICSEQSLNAPAVIREIERVLQKEDELARQGKEPEVLFPIRLDEYIFTSWQHYRKADVLAKNVGDFRKWHDLSCYQNKFERLLRDLKSESRS
jgi:hypothetical protein